MSFRERQPQYAAHGCDVSGRRRPRQQETAGVSPLDRITLAVLKKECGRGGIHIENRPARFNNRHRQYRQRIELRQPTKKALQWLVARDDVLINRAEIAFDLVFKYRADADEAWEFLHQHLIRRWHGKRQKICVTVRNGKTGFRNANTMGGAVAVYKRTRIRYPDTKGEDYIFLPQYENRQTAAKVIQRQFHELLKRAGIETDASTGRKHSLYSLRHTAICMRIILSKGRVNIFNLAKNAGTSVDQIERFYARNLPLSAELAMNLQSFGQ
jgi:hypothetical protein